MTEQARRTIDFDSLNSSLLSQYPAILQRWFPSGKLIKNEFCIGNLGGDAGDSCKINIRTGKWSDFATGDKGGDPIGLYAAAFHGGDRVVAAKALGGDNVVSLRVATPRQVTKPKEPEFVAIMPVPSGAPPAPVSEMMFGLKPTLVHRYCDQAGATLFYVRRFDPVGKKKEFLPLTFTDSGWKKKLPPSPRPLFGLDRLAADPYGTILFTEGEKCADIVQARIANALMPPFIPMAWCGGSSAVGSADFSPVAGRDIIIWPDPDVSGAKAANDLSAILLAIGCTVRIVSVEGLPPKFDAEHVPADADIEQWVLSRANPIDAPPQNDIAPIPDEYPDYGNDPDPEIQQTGFGPLPLGYDSGAYYYLSQADGQVHTLTPSQHTQLNMMAIASQAHFWERSQFITSKGGVSWVDAADWMMQSCRDVGVFDPTRIRGRGAFFEDGHSVIHLGDRLMVGNETIQPMRHKSKYIYPVSLPMRLPLMRPLPASQASKLRELCDMFTLEQSYMSILLAGWIVIAPVCGAMWWRPHIWISGPRGSGKSYVMREVIPQLLGGICYTVDGKTTEAGIRQSLGSDARPVAFDEAEATARDRDRIQNIIDLSRYASSEEGARIVKGTIGGKSHEYIIRSCFAFASINTGITEAADESRTVSIRFSPNNGDLGAEQFDEIKRLTAEVASDDFVGALIARTISLIPTIRDNARVLSRALRERYGDQRQGDTIGTLIAGAYSLHSSAKMTLEQAREWVGTREWVHTAANETSNDTDDHDRILSYLMEQPIRMPHGRDVPIGELIRQVYVDDDVEALKQLKFHGIAVEGKSVLLMSNHSAIARLMRDTQWSKAWASTLKQNPLITRRKVNRKIGRVVSHPLEIPIELILD